MLQALVSSAAFASHNLLANGAFASGISSWTLETDAGATMSWDAATGDPAPGSLRIEGVDIGTGDVLGEALSECFELPPGRFFELRARVRPETEDGEALCVAFVTLYPQADCVGDRTRLGGLGMVPEQVPGTWQGDAYRAETFPGALSYRVSLALAVLHGDGPAVCNFDSVVFAEQGTAALVEVPATTPVGLWLLIAGLVGSALFILERIV